ncbi:MAG: TIGR04255 family protein [Muribaculaceae bacterium]|nr:TIGR04255 family protein [Muribaculaceae bacterium]
MTIKRITPCPILEATIQINCTFNVEQDVLVGVIYSLLGGNIPPNNNNISVEPLPILNLPDEIRRNDPNLRDKPWFKINYNGFFILIGIYGVSLGLNPPYNGWESFKDFSVMVFHKLQENVIKEISAITLRYLDFFKEINIFEHINCSLILNEKPINGIPTVIRTELPYGNFVNALQITNGVHVKNLALGLDKDGSLIEMSLFTKKVSIDNFENIIEEAHTLQKDSFFKLLTKDFLNTFSVDYE